MQQQHIRPRRFTVLSDKLAAMASPRAVQDAVTAALGAAPDTRACGRDQEADKFRQVLQLLLAGPDAPPALRQRRVKTSPKRIADTVRLIQECGLTPTGIAYRPDGTTVIEIGCPPAPVPRKPRGFDI